MLVKFYLNNGFLGTFVGKQQNVFQLMLKIRLRLHLYKQ